MDYEIYTGTVDLDEENPGILTFLRTLVFFRPFTNPSITNDKLFGGALIWNTPLEGLRLGATYYDQDLSASLVLMNGSSIDFDMDGVARSVFSLEYQISRWLLMAEYTENYVPDGFLPGEPAGWYVGGTYRINDRFELNFNHNEFYGFKDDSDGSSLELLGLPGYLVYQEDTSLGLRVDISDSWLLKVQWNEVEGLGLISAYDLDNRINPRESDWRYFGVKATFHF